MISNILFFASILILPFHDFHVTHTTFYYNDESKSIEITIKVALEDLERSLENEFSKNIRLNESNQENKILDNLIKKYFDKHLKFQINKKTLKYQWIGKEKSDNLHDLYLYFEILDYNQGKESMESITIQNSLFVESYNYQTNIVLIEIFNEKHNLSFNFDNYIQTVLINNIIKK